MSKAISFTLGKMAGLLSKSPHLLVRQDHVLCARCFKSEPVHAGSGMPLPTLVYAYALLATRHMDCGGKK